MSAHAEGCAGAVWNQVDSWVQQAHDDRTQSGTYELLAQRLDELYERVEACEAVYEPAETDEVDEAAAPPRPTDRPRLVEAVSVDAQLQASSPPDNAAMVEMIMESAPPDPVAYKKSRLPSFDVIQQKARQLEDMDDFMEDMKAR